MSFQKAVKRDAKLRLSIAGPSGAGKTWTALTLAAGLADGAPIALIDTERGSASKYADMFSFDVMELDSFHPDRFVQGIHEAEQAGYAVLIIDSLSHAWNGTGGLLEIVEAITKRSQSKNSFTAWAEATPIQNRLIDAITRCKIHIIATMRAKQEYVMEQVNGRSMPRKVGMAPIQRDGMEFEFDVAVDMDIDNTMIVQKSRCSALTGAVIAKPDGTVAQTLKAWLHSDIPALSVDDISKELLQQQQQDTASEQQVASLRKLYQALERPVPENLSEMPFLTAKSTIQEMVREYNDRRKASTAGAGR